MSQEKNGESKTDSGKTTRGEPPDQFFAHTGAITLLLNAIGIVWWAYASFWLLDQEKSSPPPLQFFITTILAQFVLTAIVFQIVVSNKQWEAMREGLGRTDKLIHQNESIVSAAKTQAESAEKSLTQNELALISSERAYISVRKIFVLRPLNPTENPLISFEIINGGRTPARNVLTTIMGNVNNTDVPKVLLSQWILKPPPARRIEGSIGTLFANELSQLESTELPDFKGEALWAENLPRILDGTLPFYILVNVSYTDFQDRNRAFQLIAFYHDKSSRFWECGSRELMFIQVDDTCSAADAGSYNIVGDEADDG
ncbi:MAG: hypothetical protein WKF34_03680 [Pyrinomonadaceae bacterium]